MDIRFAMEPGIKLAQLRPLNRYVEAVLALQIELKAIQRCEL